MTSKQSQHSFTLLTVDNIRRRRLTGEIVIIFNNTSHVCSISTRVITYK